jgi:hypothetical protein
MTLEQLFERKRTRLLFFAGVLGVVVLLLVTRYFVLPKFDPTLTQGPLSVLAKVAEDLSATLVITVFVAAFLWWITPSRVSNSAVVVIEPRELKAHFSEALASSSEWRFFGGCGRYFRSAVLGEMRRRVRSESTSKYVAAVILNPDNDSLCERHARYRSGTRRGKSEGNWTRTRVKQELIATILVAKGIAHQEGLLEIHLYLVDHFSSFRVDLAHSCAIETREDPTAPALKSDRGTYYYDALSDEYRLWREQSRELIGGEAECFAAKDLNSLRVALAALGLTKHGLTDAELVHILSIVSSLKNPYD